MTPLASFLAKQLVIRPKHRKYIWVEEQNRALLRRAIEGIHCFEVTQCLPLLEDLAGMFKSQSVGADDLYSKFAFLPAPKTWIEWFHGSGNRCAVLLEELSKTAASATFFSRELATNLGQISMVSGDYHDSGGKRYFPKWLVSPDQELSQSLLATAHTLLVIINTPKIIGRAQHMPNRGLERDLTRGLGVGSFPLHAWTEIKLQVTKPIEIDDGEPHEAHLTGRRALHFVRKHIRIRLGRLEYVSAHWRGDPAIGLKQSRYVVTP